ncbi:MAG TPA: DUF4129 domain-containing protein [Gemmatimonadales bacterium]|nr:DUF4129 domain-containing protein [Gemmatimonadales bacterium]
MGPVAPDSLRAALDSVFADRAYHWRGVTDPLGWLGRWFGALADWIMGLRQGQPWLYWAVLLALLTLVVGIFVHVAWVAARAVRYSTAADASYAGAAAEVHDEAWFLALADRLAGDGRSAEAVRTAFQALVLELTRAGVVRYHPSKTPREYLREARLPVEARARLGGLVESLYRFAFAGASCGPSDYAEWRRRAAEVRWDAPAH